MSIIEAAKRAREEKLVNDAAERRRGLLAAVNRVLGPCRITEEQCHVEERLIRNFFPLIGTVALTLYISAESLEFMVHDGVVYASNFQPDGTEGADWYWSPVTCLADLATLQFDETMPEEDAA